MTVVEELDAAIARARGERVGVTDGPWVDDMWFVTTPNGGGVADVGRRENARHIAAWADPSVTDATVAVWQALRDDLALVPPWRGYSFSHTERAVLAQVRAYLLVGGER